VQTSAIKSNELNNAATILQALVGLLQHTGNTVILLQDYFGCHKKNFYFIAAFILLYCIWNHSLRQVLCVFEGVINNCRVCGVCPCDVL